jgi:hypothetical protein
MNRIRKVNSGYQVLITPHHKFDSQMEIMIGNWSDEKLTGYYVNEFNTLNEAMCEAFKYPDINWLKLVSDHVDVFEILTNIIRNVLKDGNFLTEFEPKLQSPIIVKNNMFHRVISGGSRFRLVYDLSDIMGFHIVNPWTQNCKEISQILEKIDRLRLFKKYTENGVIRLIGKTDLQTTYEIVIWPSMIAQYARWILANPLSTSNAKNYMYRHCLKLQKEVDEQTPVR